MNLLLDQGYLRDRVVVVHAANVLSAVAQTEPPRTTCRYSTCGDDEHNYHYERSYANPRLVRVTATTNALSESAPVLWHRRLDYKRKAEASHELHSATFLLHLGWLVSKPHHSSTCFCFLASSSSPRQTNPVSYSPIYEEKVACCLFSLKTLLRTTGLHLVPNSKRMVEPRPHVASWGHWGIGALVPYGVSRVEARQQSLARGPRLTPDPCYHVQLIWGGCAVVHTYYHLWEVSALNRTADIRSLYVTDAVATMHPLRLAYRHHTF